jgi:hypothetical protein
LLLYLSHFALGVSNWLVIYFINYTLTSSLALFITAPSGDDELSIDKLLDDETVAIEGEKRRLGALSRETLDGSWQAHNKQNRCTR